MALALWMLDAAAAAAVTAIIYNYAGYPLALWLAGFLLRKKRAAPPRAGVSLPSLSVIIPCHNEAAYVAEKIGDIRASDYPTEKVEIVVVSDGSDDGTVASATATGVTVIAWGERRGKPAALNAGAATAIGDVLVFTDANARLGKSALRELTAPFADADVGAVAGEQVISAGAEGEKYYWRFEGCVKRLEAAVGSAVGADGSLYAVRRRDYVPVPEGRLIMDDLFVSLSVVAVGKRLAYAPAAVAREDALANDKLEFARKARIMAGSLTALAALDPRVLRFIGWQLFSHKILRWFGPALLLVALGAALGSAAGGSLFALFLLALQGAFYIAAGIGWVFSGGRAPAALRAPYVYCHANAALAWGWFLYLFGDGKPAWKKLR